MNNILKQLREKRGLSQAEVAQEIGISRQMYNKYERGDAEPSLSSIRALCTLYDISYEVLIDSKVSAEDSKSCSYKTEKDFGEMEVASPSVSYKAPIYGTENYYAKILALLPKLLLSEKSRLLTEVAESITNEVEGRKSQPMKVKQDDVYIPSEEEYQRGLDDLLAYTESIGFNTKGVRWTREEMHER